MDNLSTLPGPSVIYDNHGHFNVMIFQHLYCEITKKLQVNIVYLHDTSRFQHCLSDHQKRGACNIAVHENEKIFKVSSNSGTHLYKNWKKSL